MVIHKAPQEKGLVEIKIYPLYIIVKASRGNVEAQRSSLKDLLLTYETCKGGYKHSSRREYIKTLTEEHDGHKTRKNIIERVFVVNAKIGLIETTTHI